MWKRKTRDYLELVDSTLPYPGSGIATLGFELAVSLYWNSGDMGQLEPLQIKNGKILPLVREFAPETAPIAATIFTVCGHRAVVKLVPECLVQAERANIVTLGGTQEGVVTVGVGTPDTLGFPECVLVENPECFHEVLPLIHSLQNARMSVCVKRRQTRNELLEVTAQVCGTRPEFAPVFLEEASRIFWYCGDIASARMLFSKARNIEADYRLPVDYGRHFRVIEQFASLGLCSAKVFQVEAKGIASIFPESNVAFLWLLRIYIANICAGHGPFRTVRRCLYSLGDKVPLSRAAINAEIREAIQATGMKQSDKTV